jgi:hypothetical protein
MFTRESVTEMVLHGQAYRGNNTTGVLGYEGYMSMARLW